MLLVFAILAFAVDISAELSATVWPNGAWGGEVLNATTVTALDNSTLVQLGLGAADVFSLELRGSLTPPAGRVELTCAIANGAAFVWLDDHIVCQAGNAEEVWGGYDSDATVLPWEATVQRGHERKPLFLRATFAHAKPTAGVPSIELRWAPLTSEKKTWAPLTSVPESALSPVVPDSQETRLEMQRSLLHGRWSTWAKGSYSAHALLPHGVVLRLGVCDASGACDEDATKDMVDANTDHSYTQLYFQSRSGCNVSLETSQLGGEAGADWVALITPVRNCAGGSAVAIMQMADNLTSLCAAWRRFGTVEVSANESMTAIPDGRGLGPVTVWADGAVPASSSMPADVRADHYLQRGLDAGAIAFSSGTARSAEGVACIIAAARAVEETRCGAFGALAEPKKMSQSGMMWNLLYSPEIAGTFAPVSRGWGRPWVIFDWDNLFGAYQLSLDSRDLAYSQLVAVVKTKTANGMVPNYWQPQQISYDRTEPPIGAKVLHEIYAKYDDKWLVDLLFDDLFDWSQWFLRRRRERGTGANLVVLGSDSVGHGADTPSMQAARPMYDGEFFAYNKTTQTGHMLLWDVGMTGMVAMELKALANLSLSAFDPPRTAVHDQLTAQLAELATATQAHLWNEELGVFANKFSTNGTFYPRISPTSFYPMLGGLATDDQANTLVERWLMNSSRFCVAPGGDSKGNSQACFWGLPSISADDPAFPPLGYWRGYVWGPMAQLVYWSLQQYGHLPAVARGRAALAKQMTNMGMAQWHAHHHVCENYNPGFVAANKGTDCTGDHFYHWGGLTSFVSLLEAGYYYSHGVSSSSLPISGPLNQRRD